jgi:hypothetical protein
MLMIVSRESEILGKDVGFGAKGSRFRNLGAGHVVDRINGIRVFGER